MLEEEDEVGFMTTKIRGLGMKKGGDEKVPVSEK